MTEPTARDRLVDELLLERWAPLMPKSAGRRTPKARQSTPSPELSPKRETGTGWPA